MPLHEGHLEMLRDKSEKWDLTGNNIYDSDVSEICKLLRENPHKKVLILDRTDIEKATSELAKLSLKKLSLRQTNISDESIKVLCHSDIGYLDFGCTSLKNEAADYIILHTKQTKIWVDGTNITKDKIQEINKRTESNKQKCGEELLRATLFGSTTPKMAEKSSASVSNITNSSSSSLTPKNGSHHN